jgi:hypothetical protein
MATLIQDLDIMNEKGKKQVNVQKSKKTIFSLKEIIS